MLDSLREEFRTPPISRRPVPFWFWNGALKADEIRKQLALMREQRVYQAIIHPREGLEIGYLSDAWFELVRCAVMEAKRLGMGLWIYDDYNCPSGNLAAKENMDSVAMRGKYLMSLSDVLRGPATISVKIPVGGDTKAGFELVRFGAVPVNEITNVLLLDRQVYGNRENPITTPEIHARYESRDDWSCVIFSVASGTWKVGAFVRGVSSVPMMYTADTYLIDPLNESAVEMLLANVHQRYKSAIGDEFGKTVRGFFMDEPGCYNNINTECWSGQTERGTVAWTESLPWRFLTEHGYDLLDNLFCLWDCGQGEHRDSLSVRRDFFATVASTFRDTYIGKVRSWCDANNLELAGHSLVEEDLGENARSFGNFFDCAGMFSIPGHDQVGPGESDRAVQLAKLTSSVSYSRGSGSSMAELFALQGWGMTPFRAKSIVDRAILGGTNMIVVHAFFYSTEGERHADCPPSLFFQNAWWSHFSKFGDYIARLCVLTGRCRLNDARVGLYYPADALWASLDPWDTVGSCRLSDKIWETAQWLDEAYLGYRFVDFEELLGEDPGVNVLILPQFPALLLKREEALFARLQHNGMKIVRAGDKERLLEDVRKYVLPYAIVTSDVHHERELDWTIPGCRVMPVAPSLRDWRRAVPNAHENSEPLASHRGRLLIAHLLDVGSEREVFILHCRTAPPGKSRMSGEPKVFRHDVRLTVKGAPELWDPETGFICKLEPGDFVEDELFGGTRLTLLLSEGRTVVLVFNRAGEEAGPQDLVSKYGDPIEPESRMTDAGYPRPAVYLLDGLWRLTIRDLSFIRPLGSWFAIDPRFSGTALYERDIHLTDPVESYRWVLDLHTVYHIAEVIVNGESCGVRLWPPYVFDISDRVVSGKNTIRIQVTNSSANAYDEGWQPSGLIGPVTLTRIERIGAQKGSMHEPTVYRGS